mmetsp:Transcript_36938/g.115687  ORF Transcript_36938/g.115687 Transcript_36938/m.115687 type:complete len:92 (+) Transcript_36938:318-593(+)
MTSASVPASSADVGSSASKTGAPRRIARAIATRCFSPPDSMSPRSPTTLSYPPGSRWIVSCTAAWRATSSTSRRASLSGQPSAMPLSAMDP